MGGSVDRVPPVRGPGSRQLGALAWGLTPFSQDREHEEHQQEPHLQAEAGGGCGGPSQHGGLRDQPPPTAKTGGSREDEPGGPQPVALPLWGSVPPQPQERAQADGGRRGDTGPSCSPQPPPHLDRRLLRPARDSRFSVSLGGT